MWNMYSVTINYLLRRFSLINLNLNKLSGFINHYLAIKEKVAKG